MNRAESPSQDQHAHAFAPRREDEALVTGRGRFVDDVRLPNQAFACFVRSPHANARIRAIDVAAARGAPGVVAVLTGADLDRAGVGSTSLHPPLAGRDGAKLVVPFRPALARERVRHVGEAVALVVGETPAAAQDAAERLAVAYEEADAVADLRAAFAPGAPELWPEAPGNLAIDWPGPVADDGANAREVDGIIAAAPAVARVSVVNQRLIVAAMEPRGATACYDAAADRYTLRACSQGAAALRDMLLAIMRLRPGQLRVVSEDVGGAFGMKTPAYPEYPALLVAARATGRPVHWTASRAESFLADHQARDTVTDAELALDAAGRFLALRIRHLADMGAYIGSPGAHIQTNNFARCFPGMYAIPRIAIETQCVFTNTVPTGPYRGAGRPEANYVLERVVEEAARITGIDPASLRRRNLIPAQAMPYRTPVGTSYDSGDFAPILARALALAGHAEFKARAREARRRGRLRGLGISCFLEHAGGIPTESAGLSFPGGRAAELAIGPQSTGQGHATLYPRIAAGRLGIAPEAVRYRAGDTDLDLEGSPAVASRSTMAAGSAIVKAVEIVIEKGRATAASLLEAAEADIGYRDGHFEVTGTDRRVSLFDVAERAAAAGEPLDGKATVDTPQTFPNGCHVAEVEIDPETGVVTVVKYTAVDDCGNVLDPTLAQGQLVGGIAQGLGQALLEQAVYDPAGQLVTGTFMDYAMPRAADMPPVADESHVVPATTNPLGVKGVGEAGTTGSLAAVMNAIADAIPDGRGRHLDMPATPEKVWHACRG